MTQNSVFHSFRYISMTLLIVATCLAGWAMPASDYRVHHAPPAPWMTNVPTFESGTGPSDNLYLRGVSRSVAQSSRGIGSWVPTTGSVNVLVIPIDFTADSTWKTTGTGEFKYSAWGPADDGGKDRADLIYLDNRLLELSKYYEEVSHGELHVSFTRTKKVSAGGAMEVFGRYGDSNEADRIYALATKAITGADTADANLKFGAYNAVMIVHAGSGAEISGCPWDIWSAQWEYRYGIPTNDKVTVTAFAIVPETHCFDQALIEANIGILGDPKDFYEYETWAQENHPNGGDDEESGPSAGRMLWLQADKGVSMDIDGGVYTWRDQSGYKNTASQSIPQACPKRVVGGIGGKPALQFDGIDDALTIPPNIDSAKRLDCSGSITFFAAVSFDNWADGFEQVLLSKGMSGNLNYLFGKHTTNVWKFSYDNGALTDVLEDSEPEVENYTAIILTVVVNKAAGTVRFFADGEELSEVADAGSLAYTASSTLDAIIGAKADGTGRFAGMLGELILYQGLLSDKNREAVEKYLTDKYSGGGDSGGGGTDDNTSLFSNVFRPQGFDVLGVWAHEFGHCLGLPDLYFGQSLGAWSVMANSGYLPYRPENYLTIQENTEDPLYGSRPTHPDAYCKKLAKWVTEKTVTRRETGVRLDPVEVVPSIYHLWTYGNTVSREYFLLENRAKIGYDSLVPEEGLVIYHVEDTDLRQPYVVIESADAQWADPASPSDYIYPGYLNVGTVFPMPDNDRFGFYTTPSSARLDWSRGRYSYVDVKNIRRGDGQSILCDLRTVPTFKFVRPYNNVEIAISETYLEINSVMRVDPLTLSVAIRNYDTGQYIYFSAPDCAQYYDTANNLIRIPLDTTSLGTLDAGIFRIEIRGHEVETGDDVVDEAVFANREKKIHQAMNLITLPVALRPLFSSTPHIFGSVAPGTHSLAWYDPTIKNYRYYRDNALTFDPVFETAPAFGASVARVNGDSTLLPPAGIGFWSNLPVDGSLYLRGEILVPDAEYEVPLYKGFNMIGNPYFHAVNMSDLQVRFQGRTYTLEQAVTKKLIMPQFYSWIYDEVTPTQSYYQPFEYTSGVLEPFVGYWLYVAVGADTVGSGDRVSLIFLPSKIDEPYRSATAPTSAATRTAAAVKASDTQWSMQLRAKAAGMVDGVVTVGVADNAVNTTDVAADRYAPPAAPNCVTFVAMASDSPNPLMADFRAPGLGTTRTWPLLLAAAPGATVTISWPTAAQLPRSCKAYLRDMVTGATRDLRTTSGYTLTLGAKESSRQLMLTVTQSALPSFQLTSVKAKPGFAPGSMLFTCALTQEAAVSMTIRTVAGKLVRKLPAVASANGQAVLTWDGRDSAGRFAPTKMMYQCEVTAVTPDGQTSQITTRVMR